MIGPFVASVKLGKPKLKKSKTIQLNCITASISKKICNGCTLYKGENICRREDQINSGVNRYLCYCSEEGPFPILGTILFESLSIFPGVLQKILFIMFLGPESDHWQLVTNSLTH